MVLGFEQIAVPEVDFGQQVGCRRPRIAFVIRLDHHQALIEEPFDQRLVV